MSTRNSSEPRKRLPVNPSEEHLRKQAKRLAQTSGTQLVEVQRRIARDYGAKNWAELMHIVETMRRGSDQLVSVKHDYEPLPAAARKRDLSAIREILQSGQFTQHDLDAGLAHACWYHVPNAVGNRLRLEIAQLLLDHGADPDGQYGSAYGPIVLGCGECLNVDGLKFLLDAGADVTFPPVETKYGPTSPMISALGTYGRGHNEAKHRVVDLLLEHGALVPAAVTPPILAIHRGDAKALAAMLDKEQLLVHQRFADMPYGNMSLAGATLLHCAVEFGELECLDLLISRGADINARANIIDGIGGQTPIFHAIATCGGGNAYTLEHLHQKRRYTIDMSVQATFRTYGKPHPNAVTPVEYAEEAARSTDSWSKATDRELAILREVQR